MTQKITEKYLLDKGWLDRSQIEFIYGGVFPSDRLEKFSVERSFYGFDKSTMDICFVAHKNMPEGQDKGYDTFINAAKDMVRVCDDMRFHVVGPYDHKDIDTTGCGGR